jgi:hypothetical protein
MMSVHIRLLIVWVLLVAAGTLAPFDFTVRAARGPFQFTAAEPTRTTSR